MNPRHPIKSNLRVFCLGHGMESVLLGISKIFSLKLMISFSKDILKNVKKIENCQINFFILFFCHKIANHLISTIDFFYQSRLFTFLVFSFFFKTENFLKILVQKRRNFFLILFFSIYKCNSAGYHPCH